MKRGNSSTIDVDRAVELWNIHRNWHAVAAQMMRVDGRPFTSMSVYMAVWRADCLPTGARRQRPTREERDMNETSLGSIWRPGRERWLPRRPDYKLNVVVDNPKPAPAPTS